jgi:hypothetical protein
MLARVSRNEPSVRRLKTKGFQDLSEYTPLEAGLKKYLGCLNEIARRLIAIASLARNIQSGKCRDNQIAFFLEDRLERHLDLHNTHARILRPAQGSFKVPGTEMWCSYGIVLQRLP